MRYRLILFTLLSFMVFFIGACTFPGASSPTPFVFPTPNLTLTAVFAPTSTETPILPTEPPVQTSSSTPVPAVETSDATTPTATQVITGDTRPNGSPVIALYLDTAPTIDGDLSDWLGTTYDTEEIVFGASNWTGKEDLSARYFIGWDDSNLYLGVDVTDDSFVQVSRGRYMYKGDEVEIQLDANLGSDFSTVVLNSDDLQIGLSPGNFSSLKPEAYRWFPRNVEGYLTSPIIAAKRTDYGYALEAKIPWVIFGVTPVDDARFGFALSLSDNDLAGTAIQQSMISSVSTRKLTNPTTWGTLILDR